MKVKFELRSKLAYSDKLSDEFINEIKTEYGTTGDDFVYKNVTRMFSARLWERMNERQVITVTKPAPTFFDWLFRRQPAFDIEVECREVLRRPPVMPDGTTVLMFHLNEIIDDKLDEE